MVAYTDMEESLKTDVLEICTNACEKYINDNQSVSFKRTIFESCDILIPETLSLSTSRLPR